MPPARKSKSPEPVGGIAFFLSLLFLLLLNLINYPLLLVSVEQAASARLIQFGMGAFAGLCLAGFLVRGRLSVFIHELKHSILSNLAGNRARKMKVGSDSGEFAYEYSAYTAGHNAFIALAPYWFPLFTLTALVPCLLLESSNLKASLLVLGFAWGADFALNLRDISPRQTDITYILGGFLVGLLYIFAMTAALFSYLAAWILLSGEGPKLLLYGLWQFMVHLVNYYQHRL